MRLVTLPEPPAVIVSQQEFMHHMERKRLNSECASSPTNLPVSLVMFGQNMLGIEVESIRQSTIYMALRLRELASTH